MDDKKIKREVNRLRSEVRKLQNNSIKKETNPFTGVVSGNYWTQTGMPWISSEGRKAVLTEWFWQPIRGQPRRVDTNELRQFSQTFWVHSCVTTILDEITAMDWDIVPKDGWEYEWVEEGITEIKEFLKYPNKNRESFTNIIRALIKDILEIDAGVIVKVFDINSYNFDELEPKSGAPLLKPIGERKMMELYVRDGASFLLETDKFGFSKGAWQYSYQIPAHPMWFDKDEICYIKRNQRSMSVYGYAPTQAIIDLIKSLHYSTLYNKRFFEENSIPDGILSVLDTNEIDMKNFMDNWRRDFQAQPHKFAVVNKDIKWQPFNVTQRELEFLETQSWYYKLIISAFGLTPSELGLTDELNRATSATQAELSRRKGIRPLMKIIENSINEEILPEFGYEGVEFQFIFDDPSEKAQRLGNWQLEINMGVKTPNEIRDEMGLDPIDGGDIPQGRNMLGMQPKFDGETENAEEAESEDNRYDEEEEKISKDMKKPQERVRLSETEQMHNARRNEAKQERDNLTLHPYSIKQDNIQETSTITPDLVRQLAQTYGFDGDLAEFEKGMQVEAEHDASVGHDYNIIARIVLDHLHEDPQYYSKMNKSMEKKLEESEKRDIIELVYNKLKNDIYLILQRLGQSPRQAAEVANLLQQRSRITKGIDDGQYSRSPNEVILNNRGKIEQQEIAKPKKEEPQYNKITCPYCGYPTLVEEGNMENFFSNAERFRCLQCHAYLSKQELIDNSVLSDITQTMMRTPDMKPETIATWSPKSFNKMSDIEMDTKAYVGFDYEKSWDFILSYIDSKEYRKMLIKYLNKNNKKPINIKEIDKIIEIIKKGLQNHWTLNDMKKKISLIIDDEARAERIVRTETVRATNEGNLKEFESRGIKKVAWITAPEDGRKCKICREMGGGKGNRMKVYNIKALKQKPPLHTSCRCHLTESI